MEMQTSTPCSLDPLTSRARHATVALAIVALVALAACTRAALLLRADARRLGSELEVQFTRVVDATNRAVLAVTDEDSAAAAREATTAATLVGRKRTEIRTVLESLGAGAALARLGEFDERFSALQALDGEVLALAVENTNLKAQRLAFGAGAEAAAAFRASVQAAASRSGRETARADVIAARAIIAVLDIQVLQGPHIAEPADRAMTEMEGRIAASTTDARARLAELRRVAAHTASRDLDEAAAALERFVAVNGEIVALSRRNTNVRSLALALGRRRRLTADCEERLRALQDVLARDDQTGTR
jgi:hypothetical protein